MKKTLITLHALFFALNLSSLSAESVIEECYYVEPQEQKVDENYFQELILQSIDENETFSSIEKNLRDHTPFSHHFQFKYPLKDHIQAQIFAKVMQIKAQEAHRFVPVIYSSQFISPCHLGFLREIKIANGGPQVQEHVLVDDTSTQVIFIENWVLDSNNTEHPGAFAAINSVINEDGCWYFAGTYFYSKKPNNASISNTIGMFKKTYENMMFFIQNEDVDYHYNRLYKY